MLQHGILDGTDILGLDPVLGSLAEETLAVAALVLGGLVAAEYGVNIREPNDDVGVIAANPRLGVHARHVECLAGVVGDVLVVLLQDFVKAHEVEVDVFLQLEELLGDGVHQRLDPSAIGRRLIIVFIRRFESPLDYDDLLAEFVHLLQGEILDLCELRVHLGEEGLVGDDARRSRHDGGGRRHGDGPPLRVGNGVGGRGHGADFADDVIELPVGHVVLLPEFRGDVLLEMLLVLHIGQGQRSAHAGRFDAELVIRRIIASIL